MAGFYALIIPQESPGVPTFPIAPGGPPPVIWPGPGFPAHPIAPPPPGIWGGRPPYVDIGGPGPQPGPSHPIVIPPDLIAPGVPSHPVYIPVYPAHPITIPPGALAPGVPTHPIYLPPQIGHPIVIPPDAISPGVPAHPIVIPPTPPLGIWGGVPPAYIDIGGPAPQPPGSTPDESWGWGYSPYYGWVVVPPGSDGPSPEHPIVNP